jgi:hypothetical protein
MAAAAPSFLARIPLAFRAFFGCLLNPAFAATVAQARRQGAPLSGRAPGLQEAPPDSALQLLGVLQREGRLIDFLQEELAGFPDAQVGAAARVVHEGCRKALAEHFEIAPVRSETEGAQITLERGFDASAVRLVGNVVGEAPFTGALTHRGWRALAVRLPRVASGHDLRVLAPAEVEL